MLTATALVTLAVRHRHFLASTGVFAHMKLLISFTTVVVTVDKQFGIIWPVQFQRALAALSVLSLDIGMLTSMLCAVRLSFYTRYSTSYTMHHTLYSYWLSFYTSLVITTLGLTGAIGCIYIAYRLKTRAIADTARLQNSFLFVAIYLLVFAYPVLSVKIVEAFACHIVEGVPWLRVDYSIKCYTPQWYTMAAYASVYLLVYVIGLPVFIFCTLWSYRTKIVAAAEAQGPGRVCKLCPPGLLLGFLLDDYRLELPCYLWESEEIIRKLLLSVIGSFWASKSVVSIACALVLSLVFQLLHSVYNPFKQQACNRLQQVCLSVLNFVYIAGESINSTQCIRPQSCPQQASSSRRTPPVYPMRKTSVCCL
jgi:hypothetical protein